VDITASIGYLGKAIHHFHAKDTMFITGGKSIKGVLDTGSYAAESERAWIFRTVGYGGCDWKGIISALKMAGYNGAISIEHEDSLMTPKEGLEKAIEYLKSVVIGDDAKADAFWA
jgi:DNA-(apurinic or apyrimidinic site) lyase